MQEELKTRGEVAVESWKKGLNCSQAVLLTYSDYFDIPMETLFKLSEGFGSGVGGLRRTCGALLSAVIIAGLVNSDGEFDNPKTKKSTYEIVSNIIKSFENKYGTSICSDLKGITSDHVILPCNMCIKEACLLIESELLPKIKK